MKHAKKLLSLFLALAMTASFSPLMTFAAPTLRPFINGLSSEYKGGIDEIHWGDTDWGAFENIDWEGAADKTADELAALFDETKFNVITTDSILSFESDEGAFYSHEGSEVDLSELSYDIGKITFPEGDTVIISSAKETFNLIGETTLNIPDGSSVMVIDAYQAEPQEEDVEPTVIDSDTTLNINTNETGNLAAVAFNSGTFSSCGIYAGNLNVYGTGTVASYGGQAEFQSLGVCASLVGVGASSGEGSIGIMADNKLNGTGTVSAADDAVIIGAGGISAYYSYGICTANTEARNNSSIYMCGAKVDGMTDHFPSVGLMIGTTDERTRTITADNNSNIFACGRGEGSVGIGELYVSNAENPDAEFGGVRIAIDDSVSDNPKSNVTAYGDTAAYMQSTTGTVDKSKFKEPTGSVNALGREDIDKSATNIVEFNTEKHTYTYGSSNATYIEFTKGETADYSLYYNTADSSFYKSYDEINGYSDKVESVAGATGDGENLTLTSDFKFYTSADLGLVLPEYTDINVNEGEQPTIIAGSLTENAFTAGIYSMKGCYLRIDSGSKVGALHVSGGYGNNKDSFGIYSDGIVNISGNGILECIAGCVNVSDGFHQSVGIYARRNVLISDTLVLADGGRVYADNEGAYGESIGMLSGAFDASEENDSVSDGIGTYGDAYVSASATGGSRNVLSVGCITSYLLASGNSELVLNTYGESMTAIALGIKLNAGSGIDIIDSASVSGKASGGDVSYGMSEIWLDNKEDNGAKRIAVNIYDDGSMEFEGDSLAIAATRRMFGSIDVTDGEGNTLTYDGDYIGYVNSEGKPAQRAVIKGRPDADYAIYYSEETGFRKNNKDGDVLTALPEGLSADGNTVTLNDVSFSTTAGCALIADGGVTLNIPENSRAALSAADETPVDSENPEASNVFGVELFGDSVIQADGALSVAANGIGRTFGLATYGNLTVKGKGEVIAAEFFGADHSWALMSTDNITVEDSANVYAYAMAGMDKTAVSSVSRQLTVKDNAVFDTSGGYDSSGIAIWDGYDVVTEDNASVIAKGGVILYGNAETVPGAIRASGESTVEVECNYNGDGNSVLDWGILGASGTGNGLSEDDAARIYVTDNASVSAYTVAENGGAVSRAKAAGGVSAVGGNARGDQGALEYKDDAYVLAGTDDNANYVLFKRAAADYPLYFDGETSQLYKTCDFNFDQETGDVINVTYSDPIEVPGAKCEGNKLTLTSDFQFYTDYMDGLYLGNDTTLYVPEGESPTICGGFSGLVLGAGIGGSSGIYCMGGNTLEIDGSLEVIGYGGTNISSWGIVNSTKNKPLNITGKGSLTARGGDIVYDETLGESRGDSAGIVSYGDLNISIAELNAVGGESYNISDGIIADYPSMEPRAITISGGAKVSAKSGSGNISMGCAANSIVVKDNSSLEATASQAEYSYGLVIFNWEDYGDGKIELSGRSSVATEALDLTYGVGVIGLENLKTVPVKMDNGSTFTAEGAMSASASELSGVTAVSDGKTVTYDSEKSGYVDADGNIVKKISFVSQSSGSGSGGRSGSGSSSPAPTATVEPTDAPQATSAPEATDKIETSELPFTDVSSNDWFYGAVSAVYHEGFMNGVSNTEFAPDEELTRGMLVTIIGRMGGAEMSASAAFADVDEDAYYSPYIAWAAENGIVNGFEDGTFRPDESVTREQTAAILYRYMQHIGIDVSAGENTNILSYADANEISEYAIPAIQWACGAGIMKGYPDGTLAPAAGITRAELATMISAVALI